jgi:hypothetical protein
MIIPLILSITVSIDKNEIVIPSQNEKYHIKNEMIMPQPSCHTTVDINPEPYTYIKEKTSSLLYEKIAEELLQDEEDNK